MNKKALLVAGGFVFALTATQVAAQSGNGSDVERAQQALKQAGHDPGSVDGVMGAKTSSALRAYQKAHGLEETGRLDAATSAKLDAAKSPNASPQTTAPRASSEQTGGDTKANAADPAQAKKTGANVGEGASYSRSNEKGQSTMDGADQKK
jgi:peptidoglycan hydrolase-like protein with peptidoglycan-binding domain